MKLDFYYELHIGCTCGLHSTAIGSGFIEHRPQQQQHAFQIYVPWGKFLPQLNCREFWPLVTRENVACQLLRRKSTSSIVGLPRDSLGTNGWSLWTNTLVHCNHCIAAVQTSLYDFINISVINVTYNMIIAQSFWENIFYANWLHILRFIVLEITKSLKGFTQNAIIIIASNQFVTDKFFHEQEIWFGTTKPVEPY